MLQKNRRIKVFFNMLTEAAIIFAAYHVAVYIRFFLMGGVWNSILENPLTELLILLFSFGTVVLFYLWHLYFPATSLTPAKEIPRIVVLGFLSVVALGAVLYILRMGEFSRVALGIFYCCFVTALSVKRLCWHRIVRKRLINGIGIQRVIVVGCGENAKGFLRDIQRYPQYGWKVIGYIGSDPHAGIAEYLGDLSTVENALGTVPCDEVVVALEPDEMSSITTVLNAAGKEGLRIFMIPFYQPFFPRHPSVEAVGRSILIDMRATPLDHLALSTLKRTFDIVGSIFLLILFSPLMLLTAVIIKLESPGPVFFRQKRVGKDKREFTMLKFRSMRLNADSDTAWTTGTDTRRTRFGSFIRKYSIDELPQLLNTLRGDMSLVGPRPEIPYYTKQFKDTVPLYLVRQQVRPGMTGWAQVHGLRGDTPIEARVEYDIWYIENWSLALDLRILWLTLLGGFINHEESAYQNNRSDKATV